MNKSLQILICGMLLSLVFVACHKSQPIGRNEEANTLRIELNHGGLSLRTDKMDPMTTVESLDLYFFSAQEEVAKREVVYHQLFLQDQIPTTGGALTLSLPKGHYYLVGVLNAPSWLQDILFVGAPWSNLDLPVTVRNQYFYTINEGKVVSVMKTNDQGPIEVLPSAFDSPDSSIRLTLTSSMARIVPYGVPQVPTHILLGENRFFTLAAKSSSAYLMRRLAPLVGSVNTQEKPGDGSTQETHYAYSPGYEEIAACNNPQEYGALVKRYRLTTDENRSAVALLSSHLWADRVEEAPIDNVEHYYYELTIDPEHFNICFLPGINMAIQAYPKILSQATPSFDVNDGWVSFQGKYYLGKPFCNYVRALIDRNKSSAQPKPTVQVPSDYPKPLQDLCERYATEMGDRAFMKSGDLFPIDFQGVRYYQKSLNYYYLPIRHDAKQTAYGLYGVVRNNEYRLHVTSLADFGSPILFHPGANTNLYEPKSPINTTLTIAPIEVREVEEQL